MLLFGHIGITLGVAKACDTMLSMSEPENSQNSVSNSALSHSNTRKPSRFHSWRREIKRWLGTIDYRLVIIGSLLPDLIDKPIFLLTGSTSLSGRDYAHSLLFNLVLLIGGLVLIRHRKSWLLVLSLSSFTHLVFDRMWTVPVTLWWPLLGPLLRGDRNAFLPKLYFRLFAPEIFIPEIIGLAILSFYAFRVTKRKSITRFIKEGIFE